MHISQMLTPKGQRLISRHLRTAEKTLKPVRKQVPTTLSNIIGTGYDVLIHHANIAFPSITLPRGANPKTAKSIIAKTHSGINHTITQYHNPTDLSITQILDSTAPIKGSNRITMTLSLNFGLFQDIIMEYDINLIPDTNELAPFALKAKVEIDRSQNNALGEFYGALQYMRNPWAINAFFNLKQMVPLAHKISLEQTTKELHQTLSIWHNGPLAQGRDATRINGSQKTIAKNTDAEGVKTTTGNYIEFGMETVDEGKLNKALYLIGAHDTALSTIAHRFPVKQRS